VLVGDAAGFYDPFTGEGDPRAADRRAAAGAGGPALALRRGPAGCACFAYERARAAATRDKFRFNRLLQVAVGWPAAANAMARRLARRPDLADRLVGVAGDFVPAHAAFAPRFLWDLLRA
jgi:flavin-dependent dehydrogenase